MQAIRFPRRVKGRNAGRHTLSLAPIELSAREPPYHETVRRVRRRVIDPVAESLGHATAGHVARVAANLHMVDVGPIEGHSCERRRGARCKSSSGMCGGQPVAQLDGSRSYAGIEAASSQHLRAISAEEAIDPLDPRGEIDGVLLFSPRTASIYARLLQQHALSQDHQLARAVDLLTTTHTQNALLAAAQSVSMKPSPQQQK